MNKEEKFTFINACNKLNIDTIVAESEELRISKIKEKSFDIIKK